MVLLNRCCHLLLKHTRYFLALLNVWTIHLKAYLVNIPLGLKHIFCPFFVCDAFAFYLHTPKHGVKKFKVMLPDYPIPVRNQKSSGVWNA